jgi:hypothetical protein
MPVLELGLELGDVIVAELGAFSSMADMVRLNTATQTAGAHGARPPKPASSAGSPARFSAGFSAIAFKRRKRNK